MKNGYGPSLIEWEDGSCLICGRRDRRLQRHEVFHGPFRDKSKAYGCWVSICYECHADIHAKGDSIKELSLKRMMQKRAMAEYNWTVQDFIREFGKNYL